MVKLEEVLDEENVQAQDGPIGGEDDWDTDSGMSIPDPMMGSRNAITHKLTSPASDSDNISLASDDDDLTSETLLDRLIALQDMLPPTQRRFLTNTANTVTSWAKTGALFSGKALWVVSTSLLLLGVPWALAYAEEQQMIEMEREMQMQQQANQMLTQPGEVGGDARAAL